MLAGLAFDLLKDQFIVAVAATLQMPASFTLVKGFTMLLQRLAAIGHLPAEELYRAIFMRLIGLHCGRNGYPSGAYSSQLVPEIENDERNG